MTRVYVPISWEQLAALLRGPIPVARGHAVTDQVRSELAGSDEEELEYAALGAAAADAITLVLPDRPRRVVLAVDTTAVSPDVLSAVRFAGPVALSNVAAVHVDAPDASADVAVAAAAPDDQALAEKALDHELGWYAVQEIPDLLGR